MSKDIRMIGLDLDGTLLNDKKELTPYTREVLTEAIRQGVAVLIATGRPLTAIPEDLLYFPGMRYVVTSNGARIMDIAEEKVLIESTLSIEKTIEILNIVCEYDAIYEVFLNGRGYTIKDRLEKVEEYFGEPGMAEYMRSTRTPVESVHETVQKSGVPADKVHAIFKHMDERKEAIERLKEVEGILTTGAFKNTLEINKEGTSKAEGLIQLGKELGITREQIMACGDGMNDYEMIEKVGFGVAMENGNPRVKEIADYVTVSNEEDGVAKAIQKFVLK